MSEQTKAAKRERLEYQVKEFLSRGGKIVKMPPTAHQQVYFQRNEHNLVRSLKAKDCEY